MELPGDRRARTRRRARSRRLLGAAFVLAGTLHFTHTRRYEAIVPPQFPAHRELVYVSGAAEIAGGVGAQIPQTRRAAGIGLVALLLAVYPANVHMAVNPDQIDGLAMPHWLLWARLPLQFPMMWWAWRATRDV
jgi:uncharacterized membrane protein